MLSGESIVCFAPDPWGDIWRNRHRLLSVFARSNKVLYVEPRLGVRVLARRLRSGEERLSHLLRPRVERIRESLHVYHDPMHWPRTEWRGVGPWIERRRDSLLRKALRDLAMERPILWLVRPSSYDLPGRFGEKAVLYQVVDDYLSYPGVTPQARARLEREERALAERADLVVVTSRTLLELKAGLHPRMTLVPNGVDSGTLEAGRGPRGPVPPELGGAERPLFGYIGGITEKLDLGLLEALAEDRRRRGGTLVLVGPVNIESAAGRALLGRLEAHPSVIFTGPLEAARMPEFLGAFDVGLIPYRVGDQARAIDPLKLYEYLAFGLPTVSVDIPSVRSLGEVVRIASSPAEFVDMARGAAEDREPAGRERRRSLAAANSWEERAERISQALEEAMAGKQAGEPGSGSLATALGSPDNGSPGARSGAG